MELAEAAKKKPPLRRTTRKHEKGNSEAKKRTSRSSVRVPAAPGGHCPEEAERPVVSDFAEPDDLLGASRRRRRIWRLDSFKFN